jgi:hypothetical protein
MICQNCGADIPDSHSFCTHCGTPQRLAGASVPLPAYKLDLGKLLNDTFELYKRHFGIMCLIGLVLCVVPFIFAPFSVATSLGQEMVKRMENKEILFALLVGCDILIAILQHLVQFYIVLGIIRQGLYLARGGTGFQANLMFPPLMMYLKIVGIYLLIGCISVAILLMPALLILIIGLAVGAFAGFIQHNENLMPVFLTVLIVLIPLFLIGWLGVIWVTTRLYLAPFFLADQDTGIIDSMQYSWRVTSGNFWILIVALIVLWILSMLGLILCIVGVILTITVSWLGVVLIYLQLTGQPNCLDYYQSPLESGTPLEFSTEGSDVEKQE